MVRKGQVVAVVMIGVDPHKGSHTAVALGANEAPAGPGTGPGLGRAGRALADLGRGLAGAHLGGGGRRRAGAPAGPGAGRGRGTGAWTCSLSWPPGCGCWRPERGTRTIPTMAARV